MVMEVMGMECVVGFVGVQFVVVHMSIDVYTLTKSASSTETGSLSLYLLWSIIGLVGFRSLGSWSGMSGVMRGVWRTGAPA